MTLPLRAPTIATLTALVAPYLKDPDFAGPGRVPTAENIAAVIHDALAPGVAAFGARLLRVRLQETRRNSFVYGELT